MSSGKRNECSRAVAAAWTLPVGFTPLELRQQFLRRIVAEGFWYDGRLISEFQILAGVDKRMSITRRIAAQHERSVLQEFASAGGKASPKLRNAAARELSRNCESELSRRWCRDLMVSVEHLSVESAGALQFQRPPAQRRPLQTSVAAIAAVAPKEKTPPVSKQAKEIEHLNDALRQHHRLIIRWVLLALPFALLAGIIKECIKYGSWSKWLEAEEAKNIKEENAKEKANLSAKQRLRLGGGATP